MKLTLLTAFVAVNIYSFVRAGGSTFTSCENHTQDIKNRHDIFISSIQSFQTECIASLKIFADKNAGLPKTNFTNELYEIYSDCTMREGEAFKDYYNDLLKMLTGVEEVDSSVSVMSYLTGVVDSTAYPFTCINEDLFEAVNLVSVYDKELSTTASTLLAAHNGKSN